MFERPAQPVQSVAQVKKSSCERSACRVSRRKVLLIVIYPGILHVLNESVSETDTIGAARIELGKGAEISYGGLPRKIDLLNGGRVE